MMLNSFYANKMVFQNVIGGSNNVDVVYGPDDTISPVIINLGNKQTVNLIILVKNIKDQIVDNKKYYDITLKAGRNVVPLRNFKPHFPSEGYYAIEYIIEK